MTHDFKERTEPNSQNPIMHLFEAILAFGALDGMGYMFREAEKIADFVLSKLVRQDDHILPEIYTSDWMEEQAEKGRRIDIGHAFEWALSLVGGRRNRIAGNLSRPGGALYRLRFANRI